MVGSNEVDMLLDEVLDTAVTNDRISIVKFVLELYRESANRHAISNTAFLYAIDYGSAEVMQLLLQATNKDEADKLKFLRQSIKNKRLDMVKLLIGELQCKIPWRMLLNTSLATEDIQLIEYMLAYVSPSTKSNQTLKIAASYSYEIFNLVLNDQRIDPMADILEVIRHANSSLIRKRLWTSLIMDNYGAASSKIREEDGDNSTDLLVSDHRVRTELLDSSTVRVILWVLSDFIRDREAGFNRANDLVGAELQLNELSSLVEYGTDIYSKIIRHLFIKRPSTHELLDWMIEMNDPSLREAARCVSRNIMTRKCSVPLRSLLISVAYPTLSLQDLLADLRDEGTSRENIVLSARLVGTYLGESGIQSRELLKTSSR